MSVPTPPYDLLPRALEDTFSFQFPFITQPPEYHKDRRLVGTSPFTFYDRHVGESQRLRRVASLPTLTNDMIQSVDRRLEDLRKTGVGPLPLWHATRAKFGALIKGMVLPPDELVGEITTDSLMNRTWTSLTFACLPLVSSWVIHPHAPKYYSALVLHTPEATNLPPAPFDSACEDFKIRFAPPCDVHPDVVESVDSVVKGALVDWHRRDLVTWIFLPLSSHSEQLLRDMDQLSAKGYILPSPCCSTQGFPTSQSAPPPCDANSTQWTLPAVELRGNARPVHPKEEGCPLGGGVINPRPLPRSASRSKFEEMNDSTAEGLVHHVWRMAVEQDTTVIVINSGNHERIGIRHRGSQTLYLSDMIDLTKPGYGKLHVGILISAVDDALDRYRALHEKSPATRSGKRPRPTASPEKVELRRSKRQKMNLLLEQSRNISTLSQQDHKVLWREVAQRSLLLLRFGGLCSSVPTCCLRRGKPLSLLVQDAIDEGSNILDEAYQASEYVLLTLDRENSSGKTGQVYTGHLQLMLPSGRKLLRNVVAKIAHYKAAQERVRHEYQVYQRLWGHKVKRIPEIYGLFEDVDNLATVLVMERAAFTFRQRDPITEENNGLLQEIQPSERLACIAIVKEIHRAGVVHRDLRAENIVVAQDGKPMFIDFDRAILDAREETKSLEIQSLSDLLVGKKFRRL